MSPSTTRPACCCAIPTPASRRTWGQVKSAYR